MSALAILAVLASQVPATSGSGDPDCQGLCQLIIELTQNEQWAIALSGILQPVLELIIIIVLAVVARALLRRAVGTLVAQMKSQTLQRNALYRLADAVDGGHDAAPGLGDRRARRADSMGALLQSIGTVVIWSIALLMGLAALGMNLAPLIAGAGILGVALGFGAQDLVKDFLSGVFMLAEDQYGVGDVIDAGEAAGVVEGVSLRTTRIRDVEGKLWHVPNGEIHRVANASQAWARALLDVEIAYGADIDDAIATIEAAGARMAQDEEWEQIFLEAPEVWGVEELAADSVKLRIVVKTQAGEQFRVSRELRRRLKYALDAEAIEIPFQQRTVWLRREEAAPKVTRKATAAKKATATRKARKKATSTPASSQPQSAEQEV